MGDLKIIERKKAESAAKTNIHSTVKGVPANVIVYQAVWEEEELGSGLK